MQFLSLDVVVELVVVVVVAAITVAIAVGRAIIKRACPIRGRPSENNIWPKEVHIFNYVSGSLALTLYRNISLGCRSAVRFPHKRIFTAPLVWSSAPSLSLLLLLWLLSFFLTTA